ncbi:MAG: ABC transporter substrate-binding protein [Oscillospiraceae bacterium]
MKKFLALLLTVLTVATLAACGAKPAEPAADPAAPAAPAAVTTVEAGKLHMATNAAFPPYEMLADGDGFEGTGFEGIDVEIAAAVAKKLGLELVVDDMDFAAVVGAVQTGKSDVALAGLTVSEERKKNIDFSDSYATGVQVVIVPDGSPITDIAGLDGKMIGTQEGTTGYIYCSGDYGEDKVIAYTNGATAIQALTTGKVDAVVIDNEPARAFVDANAGLSILSTEYVTEDYAIGLSKDNPDLTTAVNGALKELIADGTVKLILDKYIAA